MSIFKTAKQIAQVKNVCEFRYQVQRAELLELLKKAFPYIQDKEAFKDVFETMFQKFYLIFPQSIPILDLGLILLC